MIKTIELKNIYYSPNEEIEGYLDIFLDTNLGIIRIYPAILTLEDNANLNNKTKLEEINVLRNKFGPLYLTDIRRTYDNDIYIFVSNKFFITIEYVPNSTIGNSLQEIHVIEEIHDASEHFREMQSMELESII